MVYTDDEGQLTYLHLLFKMISARNKTNSTLWSFVTCTRLPVQIDTGTTLHFGKAKVSFILVAVLVTCIRVRRRYISGRSAAVSSTLAPHENRE
jgi:hypothetical protein